MSVVYEVRLTCGCKTDGFDPRQWRLCAKHDSSWAALADEARRGAKQWREWVGDDRVPAPDTFGWYLGYLLPLLAVALDNASPAATEEAKHEA